MSKPKQSEATPEMTLEKPETAKPKKFVVVARDKATGESKSFTVYAKPGEKLTALAVRNQARTAFSTAK